MNGNERIGEMVVNYARAMFKLCDAIDDFKIHKVSNGCVVFGQNNRVMWTIHAGFEVCREHCSEQFLELYDAMRKEGG